MLKKLPNLSRIKSYEQFYKYLVRSIEQPKDTVIDTTKFYLTSKNEKTLANHLKKICRKNNKDFSKKWFDSAWGMEHLNYSPCIDNTLQDGYCFFLDMNVFVKASHHKES